MNKTEIARLARQKMNEHGFGHIPFEWGRGKRRIGSAHFTRNRLTGEVTPVMMRLSANVIPYMDDADVIDTILHEIAHLMTPGHGHDRAWKAACRQIGARPERTTEAVPEYVQKRLAAYTLVCAACGTETYLYRRPKHGLNAYRHKGCGGSFRPR